MVVEVIISLIPFVILYTLILIIFGIMIKFITDNKQLGEIYTSDDGSSDASETFHDNLYNIFLQSLGGWSNDEISFGLFLNIFMVFMMPIVMLNILIAKVGDTYERVLTDQVSH